MDLKNHPCFNDAVRKKFGRVHLPVAPKCNVQCNFCNRKFDCVNESRPGVASSVLNPYQALAYLDSLMARMDNLTVVGIAGPGDPFANAEDTMLTMRLVRERYQDMLLCVATNGMNIAPYVEELAELNVSHVTLTINAVDPEVGARIYSWFRGPDKRVLRGIDGASALLNTQLDAVRALKKHGIAVKVNSIIIPGVNEDHVVEVAKEVHRLGVDIFNPIPMYKTEGSIFADINEPDVIVVREIKAVIAEFMPLMHHCVRCRADAVGCLDDKTDAGALSEVQKYAHMPAPPRKNRPYVAVASYEGLLINQHLGEAEELLIFDMANDGPDLVSRRATPPKGNGLERWQELSDLLHDCSSLLVSGVGENPLTVLQRNGIEVMVLEGLVEEALNGIFSNGSINHMLKRSATACGASCSGSAGGCG